MKAITLEELSRIQADYKIPKDVRAEKEIEDLAFDTMEWTGWKRPESLIPDMEDPRARDGVLVIVSGTGKNTLYTHAICEAFWEAEKGWMLPNDPRLEKFTVERWAYYPYPPQEIVNELKKVLPEVYE